MVFAIDHHRANYDILRDENNNRTAFVFSDRKKAWAKYVEIIKKWVDICPEYENEEEFLADQDEYPYEDDGSREQQCGIGEVCQVYFVKVKN